MSRIVKTPVKDLVQVFNVLEDNGSSSSNLTVNTSSVEEIKEVISRPEDESQGQSVNVNSSSVEPIQIVISSHEEESDGQSDPTEEYAVSRTTVSNPEEESELQSESIGESTVFSPAAVESGKTPDTVSIPHEESGQTIELTVSSPQAKTGEQVEQIKRKDAVRFCDFRSSNQGSTF